MAKNDNEKEKKNSLRDIKFDPAAITPRKGEQTFYDVLNNYQFEDNMDDGDDYYTWSNDEDNDYDVVDPEDEDLVYNTGGEDMAVTSFDGEQETETEIDENNNFTTGLDEIDTDNDYETDETFVYKMKNRVGRAVDGAVDGIKKNVDDFKDRIKHPFDAPESAEDKAMEKINKAIEKIEKQLEKLEEIEDTKKKIAILSKMLPQLEKIGGALQGRVKQIFKFYLEEFILEPFVKRLKSHLVSKKSLVIPPQYLTVYQKAKKHKKFKKQLREIRLQLLINWKHRIAQIARGIAESAPTLCSIILAGSVCLIFIMLLAGDTKPDDVKADSEFGAKGKDFYAVRTVYKDDEQAKLDIVEDYVIYIESSTNKAIEEIKANSTYDAESVTANIIPENYTVQDVLDFNKMEYDNLRTVLGEMVNMAYSYDNNVDIASIPASMELIEKINAIKYMGIDSYLQEKFKTIIADGICPFFHVEDTEHVLVDPTTVTEIPASVNEVLNNAKLVRTEKLYVKDFILQNDDDTMKDILQEQYVAAIYLPKRDLTINHIQLRIWHHDKATFQAKIVNGTTVYEFDNIGGFGSEKLEGIETYGTTSNIYAQVTAFTNGLQPEVGVTDKETSLLSLAKQAGEGATYLEQKADETTGNSYSTFKIDGIRLEFDSDQAFNFVEADTEVA